MAKQKKVLKRKIQELKKYSDWSDAQHKRVSEQTRQAWENLRDYYTRMA